MRTTKILASTRLRPYGREEASQFARWAAEAECDGAYLASPWPQADMGDFAAALDAQGLALAATQLPLPEAPVVTGKRLPYWGSLDDPEERLAAIKLADQTLTRAKDFGCTWAFLDAFTIKLKAPSALFVQSFAENRWDRDRSSHVAARPILQAALKERAEFDERLCDAARFSLERLARVADARGVRVAVGHGVGPWQFPGPREVDLLLQEFGGAALIKAHLPARLDVLHTLGLLSPERRLALAQAPFVMATDAIGLRDDLAPGLGPQPLQSPLRQSQDVGPQVVVVSGRSDTTQNELRAAVARVAGLVT